MSDFQKFNKAINNQLAVMQAAGQLFEVAVDRDELFEVYLGAFREGDDPIYIERTEHDCNCCKQFIRKVGNVVIIENGQIHTIWDVDAGSDIYQPVADALSAYVKSKPVKNVFISEESSIGVAKNNGMVDGRVIPYEHFHTKVNKRYVIARGNSISQAHGAHKATHDVFKRSLEEISMSAIEVVEDLISQNSIYKGKEYENVVKALKRHKTQYDKLKTEDEKTLFLWRESVKAGYNCRYKNTVIGTLLADISEGVELEKAVGSFEQKVAPENYKRSKALITPNMIKKAQEAVEALGIEESLHRRFAVETDLTVNNVLFADRSTAKKMQGGVFDELVKETSGKPKKLSKVEEVTAEDFVKKILPKAESIEVMVENKHTNNFMSIIAPVYDDSPNIMKWDNNYSWSYAGEVTDSIKERVKAAGGQVDADVRVSLSWSNYDDLDLHVKEPNGNIIYFGDRKSSSGGELDVDMNAGGRSSRTPVENIFWKDQNRMKEGEHIVYVNQFSKREKKDVGFEVQFACGSDSETFYHPKDLTGKVEVLRFNYSKRNGVVITKRCIESESKPQDMWGLKTQQFHKVKMVMDSPNHWDDQAVGNKHLFFILEDCINPDQARGFYNEFLRNDLNEHRKVFEVLAGKMKTPYSNDQLSGLGFSETKRAEVLVKVSGSFNRTLKVKF